MTLKEACIIAVKTNNAKMAGTIVNQLRNMQFNYDDCAAFFGKTTGIDVDQFEDLMYAADKLGEQE